MSSAVETAARYFGAALIWGATLAFQAWLVSHGQPLNGWIGMGGFILGGACIGIEIL